MTKQELISYLTTDDEAVIAELYRRAYEVKKEHVGTVVYFRGIVEFGNQCAKNCFYCGIRRDNAQVERFMMSADEIIETARSAYEMGYGSIVLQSGERNDAAFVAFVEDVIKKIHEVTDNELGITLSLGEQSRETFERWFNAGVSRYLLRIETSNAELYRSLHPDDHDFDARRACLNVLREEGYQVGTGIMIGLPGQTEEHLAADILFFKEQDIDMIGMGPFIVHHETPLKDTPFSAQKNLTLALKMIALTRCTLKDVNIAATTALQALDPEGRELGLKAGANIIMPNITPTTYRAQYQLYENKPCLDENADMCRGCLEKRITSIGETIGYNRHGDSPHFFKRINTDSRGFKPTDSHR